MEKQHDSATTIQSLYRGNVARSELAARKEARKKQKETLRGETTGVRFWDEATRYYRKGCNKKHL
jgi:hypothetical protein